MVNFHASDIAKDIHGRPVVPTTVSDDEILTIKNAIRKHPKHPPEANDPLDKRLDALIEKPIEEWENLSNQNIIDLNEVVNKKLQDDEEAGVGVDDFDPILLDWKDRLHQIWVDMNPS